MQPFNPGALLMLALLNPIVALVGFLMGRTADQPQKLVVAGFTASIAGSGAVWIATWLRLLDVKGIGGEAGLFVLQCVTGLAWAALGYYVFRKPK